MHCKFCNYPDTEVVRTLQNDMRNLTERRRECLRCHQRFTTHEKLRDESSRERTQ
jgi:transcriptional repressor NrdR